MLSSPDLLASKRFEKDPRRRQEIAMRPFIDDIYQKVFGHVIITRHDSEDKNILDREHAVDVMVRFDTGNILNGQEKSLSYGYAKYQSLTVEYEQSQFSHREGDWFKLGAQFYFCGYTREHLNEGFLYYVIVNWTSLVLATLSKEVKWKSQCNRDGSARASFKWIAFDSIPTSCIIAKG